MDAGAQQPTSTGPHDVPAETAVGAVVQRRIISWSSDGAPVAGSVPMIPKEQISSLAAAALSLPYEGKEPEFQGMTNAEVMMIRRARSAATTGDTADSEALLDRAIGKPKQTTESLKVNVNYEDYLKHIAEKTEDKNPIINAEVIRPTPVPPVAGEDIFG